MTPFTCNVASAIVKLSCCAYGAKRAKQRGFSKKYNHGRHEAFREAIAIIEAATKKAPIVGYGILHGDKLGQTIFKTYPQVDSPENIVTLVREMD